MQFIKGGLVNQLVKMLMKISFLFANFDTHTHIRIWLKASVASRFIKQNLFMCSKQSQKEDPWFKPHLQHSVVSMGKTLYPHCSTAEVGV